MDLGLHKLYDKSNERKNRLNSLLDTAMNLPLLKISISSRDIRFVSRKKSSLNFNVSKSKLAVRLFYQVAFLPTWLRFALLLTCTKVFGFISPITSQTNVAYRTNKSSSEDCNGRTVWNYAIVWPDRWRPSGHRQLRRPCPIGQPSTIIQNSGTSRENRAGVNCQL